MSLACAPGDLDQHVEHDGIGPVHYRAGDHCHARGPQSLLSWGVGAALALCDGLVVAELGAALPGSGGSYVFLRDSLGREN